MKREELLQLSPYGLPHAEKKKLYEEALTELTEFHRHGCPAYGRFLDVCGCRRGGRFLFQEDGGLEDVKLTDTIPLENIPFLPVSVFKEMDLVSVPEAHFFGYFRSAPFQHCARRRHFRRAADCAGPHCGGFHRGGKDSLPGP